MRARGNRHATAAGGIGVAGRVIIEMHGEHLPRGIVGGAYGAQHDIAAVGRPTPVDEVVLPAGRQMQPANVHRGEPPPLPRSDEREALAMEEVELAVERAGAKVRHRADAPERCSPGPSD